MSLAYPIQTTVPHQHNLRPDGSHCCGCWNLLRAQDGRHYAVCNECGSLINAPLPAGVEAWLPVKPLQEP